MNFRAPVANPDTLEACLTASATYLVQVLGNDSSFRPLDCTFPGQAGSLTQPAIGSVVWVTDPAALNLPSGLCPQKAIRFTMPAALPPNPSTTTFTYTIKDTSGCTSTATVTVNISSPRCVDDCADMCATVGNMVIVNVLANDASTRPINCGLLSGTAGLTNGTYGTTAWTTDASCANGLCNLTCVKYTLNSIPPGAITADAFTYTITDNIGCPVTCTVQVKLCKLDAVNDGPISVCSGTAQKICVLDNDTSTCGALSCLNLSFVTAPAHGIVQIVNDCNGLPTGCGTSATGCTGCCLVYTSETGYAGNDTFTYKLTTNSSSCPGGTPITCTDTATVSVVVKPSPVAVDDMYDLTMSGTAGPFDVRTNDSPGVGCELTGCGGPCVYQGCPEIIQQPLHGSVSIDAMCKITYTATVGVPFPGSDRFCYRIRNNCGCCATACVTISECPCINRRQPGSLLLYPEYDTRTGQMTFITVSNASCDYPNNFPVTVEFIYIDKETCGESNFTRTLTPCDTLTLLAGAQNTNPSHGYMYAFAKDAQGRPISHNFLIGDLMVSDGIAGTSYGINPVSFRSPLARGVLTDLDADGIRDLNGLEYDPAPDELTIPRFLGQDLPGTGAFFVDELVVLALSGGTSFQTRLQFKGYNDNEVPFSAQKTFYCWEKWKLTDISGGFNNAYLKSLGDDVLEIIGYPARETGWFRLNGLTAFSSAEQINDPAVYAFLIERVGSLDRVAELPWEICTQGNGDLLPDGPFGDGPVPVNGDNQ